MADKNKNRSIISSIIKYFSFVTTILVVLVTLSFIFYIYSSVQKLKTEEINKISDASSTINRIISSNVEYARYQLYSVAKQLSKAGGNKKKINQILSSYKTNINNDFDIITTWNMFSWIDAEGKLTVDGFEGIMKKPIDMKHRDYLSISKQNLGKLITDKPIYGVISGRFIVPIVIGVADEQGKYIGTIVFGIDIAKLTTSAELSIKENSSQFFIMDNDKKLVVKSSLLNDKKIEPLLTKFNFDKTIFDDDKIYNLKNSLFAKINKIENLSGDSSAVYLAVVNNESLFADKVQNFITQKLLIYLTISLFGALLLAKIYYRIIRPIKILCNYASNIQEQRHSTILLEDLKSEEFKDLYKALSSIEDHFAVESSLKSQLDKANRHLQTLNKSINHDLRNYISGILGVAQIIADESVVETQHLASPNAKETQDVAKETQDVASLQQINQNSKLIIDQAKIMLKFSNALMTDEGIERKLKLQMANRKLGEETEEDDFEDIDIAALINQLILLKRPFTKEQEVSVKIDITESLPILRTNLIEIRKILDNLITNAIKYSPKGSEVRIVARCLDAKNQNWIATAEPRNDGVGSLASKPETPSFCHGQSPRNDRGANGDAAIQPFASSQPLIINSSTSPSIDSSPEKYLQIEIIDNGIGMSPEDIEKALSGEGKSIDKSGIDKPIDSHGIGFPIVKQAVENLDAVMEIKSEKGKGTKITVRFKVGKKQIAADCGGELHSPLQPSQSQSTSTPSTQSTQSSLNGKTILIADDEALILMATERQLMRLGCNVLTAKSGDEAITILDNNHCDVVLMDCNMTKINDGLATTKLIREGSIFKNFKNYKTIPIIAFSANTDQKSQDAALQSGMNGYLEKPFDKEMFAKIVNGFQD